VEEYELHSYDKFGLTQQLTLTVQRTVHGWNPSRAVGFLLLQVTWKELMRRHTCSRSLHGGLSGTQHWVKRVCYFVNRLVRYSCLLHNVGTRSATHVVSYSVGTWGSFAGGKAAATWLWPLPFSPEVTNEWRYTSIHLNNFMACAGTTVRLSQV
jgi:hypothetical protein